MTIDYRQDGMVIAMERWIDIALDIMSRACFDKESDRLKSLALKDIAEQCEWHPEDFDEYDCFKKGKQQ